MEQLHDDFTTAVINTLINGPPNDRNDLIRFHASIWPQINPFQFALKWIEKMQNWVLSWVGKSVSSPYSVRLRFDFEFVQAVIENLVGSSQC